MRQTHFRTVLLTLPFQTLRTWTHTHTHDKSKRLYYIWWPGKVRFFRLNPWRAGDTLLRQNYARTLEERFLPSTPDNDFISRCAKSNRTSGWKTPRVTFIINCTFRRGLFNLPPSLDSLDAFPNCKGGWGGGVKLKITACVSSTFTYGGWTGEHMFGLKGMYKGGAGAGAGGQRGGDRQTERRTGARFIVEVRTRLHCCHF